MKLDLTQIKTITLGAARVTEEGDLIRFSRFTAEEAKTADSMDLSRCSAGIRLSFRTDATAVKLGVFTEIALPIRSYFSFDIYEDDVLLGHIRNFSEEDVVGIYPDKVFACGNFSGEFPLKGGSKVDIYFPHSVAGSIRYLELENAGFVTPVKPQRVILAYGDSITQGFDALHPVDTYTARLGRAMDAEVLNKGIGGAVFTPALVTDCCPQAQNVLIAYGCNDWDLCSREEFIQNASRFVEAVYRNHPHAKITVLSPIWRLDHQPASALGEFTQIHDLLVDICRAFPDVRVVQGWDFVPHETTFFGDGRVHPNAEGFALYWENLRKVL